MRLLPYTLIVLVIICSQSCFFKYASKGKRIKTIKHSSLEPVEVAPLNNIQANNSIDYFGSLFSFISFYRFEILSVLLLLWLLIIYRRYSGLNKNKNVNLDENEIALIDVASDALNDLQYRINKKSKVKVLPFSKDKNENNFKPNDSSIINN